MTTHRYFQISTGLRGCYMPDNAYVIKVATRRDLKAAVESEASSIRDANMVGASKRAVAWIAARAWREARAPKPAYLPFAIPYKDRGTMDYPFGIFASVATRANYLEYQRDCD